jgi:hypothetical protein
MGTPSDPHPPANSSRVYTQLPENYFEMTQAEQSAWTSALAEKIYAKAANAKDANTATYDLSTLKGIIKQMEVEIKADSGASTFASMKDGVLTISWEDYNVDSLGGMDIECTYTVPDTEFAKIYARYAIDPKIQILNALQLIVDSARGHQLFCELSDGTIATSEKNYWQH